MTGANSHLDHLDFLLSDVHSNAALYPEHSLTYGALDLANETIRLQRFHSVSPGMIALLLGFPLLARMSGVIQASSTSFAWLRYVAADESERESIGRVLRRVKRIAGLALKCELVT